MRTQLVASSLRISLQLDKLSPNALAVPEKHHDTNEQAFRNLGHIELQQYTIHTPPD